MDFVNHPQTEYKIGLVVIANFLVLSHQTHAFHPPYLKLTREIFQGTSEVMPKIVKWRFLYYESSSFE